MESESARVATPDETPPSFELPALRDGAVLSPGDYLIELELGARASVDDLVEGFRALGFTRACFDCSPRATHLPAGPVHVAARLGSPLTTRSIPRLRWTAARRLNVDLGAPLRLTLEPFPLASEQVYEVRLLTRMLQKKDLERYGRTSKDAVRAFVTEKLAEGGWETIALTLLHDDVRAKDRPHSSMSLWFGLLRWTGPESFVTDDPPFHFEDVIAV